MRSKRRNRARPRRGAPRTSPRLRFAVPRLGSGLLGTTPRKRPRPTPRPASRGRRFAAPIGCGVDVVELARFRQAVKRGGQTFLRRIFTEQEEAYARARRQTTLLHLAGRFAAKEAVIKAVSQVDPTRTLMMNQVEVRNDRLGRPHILLHDGRAGEIQIHVSLSHVDTVAVASAIAIR